MSAGLTRVIGAWRCPFHSERTPCVTRGQIREDDPDGSDLDAHLRAVHRGEPLPLGFRRDRYEQRDDR